MLGLDSHSCRYIADCRKGSVLNLLLVHTISNTKSWTVVGMCPPCGVNGFSIFGGAPTIEISGTIRGTIRGRAGVGAGLK